MYYEQAKANMTPDKRTRLTAHHWYLSAGVCIICRIRVIKRKDDEMRVDMYKHQTDGFRLFSGCNFPFVLYITPLITLFVRNHHGLQRRPNGRKVLATTARCPSRMFGLKHRPGPVRKFMRPFFKLRLRLHIGVNVHLGALLELRYTNQQNLETFPTKN